MKPNIETVDRALRIILCLGITNHSWLGAIGFRAAAHRLRGFCPLYPPLSISTRG